MNTLRTKGQRQDTDWTRVIFRTYRKGGDVIALMPELEEAHGLITCYQHLGQHGIADYQRVMADTRLSTPEERWPLQAELESIGYRVAPMERWVRRRRG